MNRVFFSYSHADEDLRDMLEKHLAALKHQGLIETWYDRRIQVGDELDGEIDQNLETASIILLLVSSDFIASKYCYDIEMKRALERHEAGEARVIPVILRACDWHDTPFGRLMAAPKDGKPIRAWHDIDAAFMDVVKSIKETLRRTTLTNAESGTFESLEPVMPQHITTNERRPRSANLRTRKTFNDADRDNFLDEAFEYIASYFENSLSELEKRNNDLATRFKRVDNGSFTASIYENGRSVSYCKIRLGGMLGNGIAYSMSDQASDNSFNENLSVDFDDQHLFLKPLGFSIASQRKLSQLSFEGAAEYYWSMLMQPLQ